MHSLLYDIGGRILGLCVIFYFGRVLRRAWIERKIAYTHYDDILWIFTIRNEWIYARDAKPVRYWTIFAGNAFMIFSGVILAIFGWSPAKS